MTRTIRLVPLVFAIPLILASDVAFARGGGPNVTNSYGYQRRLQESQGLVTIQSSPAPVRPVAVHRKKKPKH
jgi:hypothetical protein